MGSAYTYIEFHVNVCIYMYCKFVALSKYVHAIFQLFGATSIEVWLWYSMAAYMQCSEFAKAVKAGGHNVACDESET